MPTRCPWCLANDRMIAYHDREWGVPVHNDRKLFEFMLLDAFQAGLSWSTILDKRPNFKKAFDNFDPKKIARYDKRKIAGLIKDAGIIRNRLKIEASIKNARAFLQTKKEFGTFDQFIWQFVGDKPKQNTWKTERSIPAETRESQAMSKALKKREFSFVGPTICYAFMQAAGMVNDHLVSCFRYKQVRIGR